jgi:nitrite reductase/ring-hydroxylating ferredoxin subunit
VNITQRDRDLGTAYAVRPSTTRTELTAVGRGSPMGKLLRRYWHPIGLSSDAGDAPRKVRALGEDLILFRDRHGRPGLLHARCCHRATTLHYGKVEEDGIRCCYHGWKFDTEGHCLEQPCEPDGGSFKDIGVLGGLVMLAAAVALWMLNRRIPDTPDPLVGAAAR